MQATLSAVERSNVIPLQYSTLSIHVVLFFWSQALFFCDILLQAVVLHADAVEPRNTALGRHNVHSMYRAKR